MPNNTLLRGQPNTFFAVQKDGLHTEGLNDISITPFCQTVCQTFSILLVLQSSQQTLNRHSTAALLSNVEFAFTNALAII